MLDSLISDHCNRLVREGRERGGREREGGRGRERGGRERGEREKYLPSCKRMLYANE
jgi:hypothetical protein